MSNLENLLLAIVGSIKTKSNTKTTAKNNDEFQTDLANMHSSQELYAYAETYGTILEPTQLNHLEERLTELFSTEHCFNERKEQTKYVNETSQQTQIQDNDSLSTSNDISKHIRSALVEINMAQKAMRESGGVSAEIHDGFNVIHQYIYAFQEVIEAVYFPNENTWMKIEAAESAITKVDRTLEKYQDDTISNLIPNKPIFDYTIQ